MRILMARARHALLLATCGGLSMAAVSRATAAVIEDAEAPALVLGADGLGLLAYYDRVNGDLKVAHCVDAACTAMTTVTVDATGDVGHAVGLALGPTGPVISYRDATQQDLKLALCADPLCTSASVAVIDPDVGDAALRTAVAMGADGLPLVAYVTGSIFVPTHELRVAHCENAACTAVTRTALGASIGNTTAIGIGGDGLGVILHTRLLTGVAFVHCANVACTAASPGPASLPRVAGGGGAEPPSPFFDSSPSLLVGPDGFVRHVSVFQGASTSGLRVTRCHDALCSGSTVQDILTSRGGLSLARGADGFHRIAAEAAPGLPRVLNTIRCLDTDCTTYEETCSAGLGQTPSLVVDGNGALLVAFERGRNAEVMTPPTSCTTAVAIDDAARIEGTGTQQHSLSFRVSVAPPPSGPITITYQTVPGTAQPGVDYVPVSGTLTYLSGLQPEIGVPLVADSEPELDETMEVVLSVSPNALLADGRGRGTIIDDEPPVATVSGCSMSEGDSGTTGCVFQVTLSESPQPFMPARVDFATADGTATAGTDYLAQSGTLSFQPGTLMRTVTVAVVGDTSVELDETFFVNLSNPVNATIADGQGEGLIVDDDAASLSSLELTHGARVAADLAAGPGPSPDADVYRLAQGPYTSWEIFVDEVSGDVAPGLVLERLAEDNSTVLQSGAAVGTGSARALRWQRRAATPEVRQHIRVRSASCTSDCGADDTYRLRTYETTGVIPRFNNSGTQVTVLILQNATGQSIQANADFWTSGGVLAATVPVSLAPNAVGLVNTASVPALVGTSGSVTVTHDGLYGGVVGKAVALEPSTGFSFDSPMTSKPR